MNKLLLVVLFACGHSSQPPPQQQPQPSAHDVESHDALAPPPSDAQRLTEREALMQEMQKLSDDMCNCKDAACATKVADELKRWSEAAEKRANPPRMSDDDVKRARELSERMGRCMAALVPPAAGSATAPSPR
jgi:hypothetical protein